MPKCIPFILFLLPVVYLSGQVSPLSYLLPGTVLEQSFNSLPATGSFSLSGKGPHNLVQLSSPTSGLQGWYILQVSGSQTNTSFSTGSGSATGSGIYSYGTSGNQNRALGSLASGTGVYAFGLFLKNETGLILNRIKMRFLVTQWRKGGSGNKNTWRFSYQNADSVKPATDTLIKESRFNLTSIHSSTGATTLNGFLPANQVWIEDSITNLYWLPGEELILQWSDFDEAGSDDAIAIDDFSFKAFQQANIPVIGNITTDSIGSRFAFLRAFINDQLSNTLVELQIDSAVNMLTAFTVQNIVPPAITGGSGNVLVSAIADHLLPAKKYYYRFVAKNQQGINYSSIQHFTTKVDLPVVQTDSLLQTGNNSCTIFGSVISAGGDTIQEKGICWSTDSFPTINHNSILVDNINTIFQTNIYQLPTGTKIFFRTYCKNAAGIAYGNTLSWFTPTTILSFKRNGSFVCNKDTIVYELQTREKTSGITIAHFQLLKDAGSDASIIQLRESHLSWQIVISTGNNGGNITPVFLPSKSYEPNVVNTPYTANTTMIDKTGPVIHTIHLENRSYRTGDTIYLRINSFPEKGILTMTAGNLLGYPLQQFSKITDSSWKTFCVIKNDGQEISAAEDISVTILLSDEAGNQNKQSSFQIIQNKDAIDVTRPLIDRIITPGKLKLKSGDSLLLQVQFSEAILIDSSNGVPVLSVTIGTRIRNPFLFRVANNNLFIFCYIIQPDEIDMDGIRIASSITLNNAIITDIAGNLLNNNIPNAGIFSELRVDAVAPVITSVITPVAKTYGIGDSLYFHVFVSEALVIPNTHQPPFLDITVDNTTYQITYLHDTHHPLSFYWVVPKEVSDKNGLSITNMMMNSAGITDSIGNKIEPVLKNIGSLSNVFIDGLPPVFKDSIVIAEVCTDNTLDLVEIIKLDFAEQGESLNWTILTPPTNGRIQGFPFNSKWTNGSQLLSNINYKSTHTGSGFDECIIQVSDGVNKASQKIKIQVNPRINDNIITTDQIICAGFSALPLESKQLKGGNGIYQFTWESNSGNSNNYQRAAGVYNNKMYHPLSLNNTTKFRRIVSSGTCTDTSNNIIIDVRTNGLWLGGQSNNWNTGANWCGGLIPDRQTDVFINHSNSKNIIQVNDSAFCKSLFIDTSHTLILNASFLFTGSLSGLKNIDAKNGTIISGGKEKQALFTDVFSNRSIARLIVAGSELELNDSLYLSDYFSVQKGIFNTHNRLLLEPRAMNYPNAAGVGIKGKISVRKNIMGRQKELLMYHPFKDDLSIQIPNDSIYTMVSSQIINKSAPLIEWQPMVVNNNTNWPAGKGIVLLKPGFAPFNKEPVLLSLNGAPITGDTTFEFPIGIDSNYLLTGNPYMAAVNSLHITRSEGIGNYYWVWDTSLAEHGAYRTKAFSANNTIRMFDGFIIKTIPNKPLFLSYSEQAKLISAIPDSLEAVIDNTHQLEIELIKDNTVLDKLLILDVDSARIKYDAADAEKIINPESNLYSLSADTIPLSVDARWITNRAFIPLGIDVKAIGQFILKFSRVWLKPGSDLELHDNYTGNKIKIDSNAYYPFNITRDAESIGRNRFVISSPQQPEPPDEVLQLQLYPVPAAHSLIVAVQAKQKAITTILIRNLQGQTLISRAIGEQQVFTREISVAGLLKGQYIAEVHVGKYVIAKTFIKL